MLAVIEISFRADNNTFSFRISHAKIGLHAIFGALSPKEFHAILLSLRSYLNIAPVKIDTALILLCLEQHRTVEPELICVSVELIDIFPKFIHALNISMVVIAS